MLAKALEQCGDRSRMLITVFGVPLKDFVKSDRWEYDYLEKIQLKKRIIDKINRRKCLL